MQTVNMLDMFGCSIGLSCRARFAEGRSKPAARMPKGGFSRLRQLISPRSPPKKSGTTTCHRKILVQPRWLLDLLFLGPPSYPMARHRASVARHTLKVMLVTSTDMAAISGFWDVDMSMHSWENVGYIYGYMGLIWAFLC